MTSPPGEPYTLQTLVHPSQHPGAHPLNDPQGVRVYGASCSPINPPEPNPSTIPFELRDTETGTEGVGGEVG